MRIIVKAIPRSINNLYFTTKFGSRIINKAGKEFIKYVQQCFEEQFGIIVPSKERIDLTIIFYFGDKRKRDLDNQPKICLDALNGFAFDDDGQIDILKLVRAYDKSNPRVEIILKEILQENKQVTL